MPNTDNNPKTTISGYIGLAGTILATVGAIFQAKPWGQTILAIGVALGGSNAMGNIYAQDAKK